MCGSYYQRFPIRIGIVCDRFYYEAIEDAADFVYLPPDVDDETLASLDLLLVVTTWCGLKNDEWAGMRREGKGLNLRIKEIINICKREGKTTIFLSKEDPPNYHYFIGLAKCCDYVFTTAEECVPYYIKACKHERVFVSGFCINPRYHNPIGLCRARKRNAVIFAGSWAKKYPQRCRDLEMMLDGVIAAGYELTIYNRNYFRRDNPRYQYPEKYQSWLKPSIDHLELQQEHHSYDWAININSVRRSFSMFANRVYELQAVGNLLLSNANPGMIKKFPKVFVVRKAEEVKPILNAFSADERYCLQIDGVREVMTAKTCFERVHDILEAIGIKTELPHPKVLVIADDVDACRHDFLAQTYPHKQLVAATEVCEADCEGVEYIALFDSKFEYDAHYLEDTINAFKYTNATYVTSGLEVEHEMVDGFKCKARTVFSAKRFSIKAIGEFAEEECLSGGYAIDRFCCGEKGQWTEFKHILNEKRARFAAEIFPDDLPRGRPEFCKKKKKQRKKTKNKRNWTKKLPFPLNKVFGGFLCLNENGLRYTLRHLVDKLRRK